MSFLSPTRSISAVWPEVAFLFCFLLFFSFFLDFLSLNKVRGASGMAEEAEETIRCAAQTPPRPCPTSGVLPPGQTLDFSAGTEGLKSEPQHQPARGLQMGSKGRTGGETERSGEGEPVSLSMGGGPEIPKPLQKLQLKPLSNKRNREQTWRNQLRPRPQAPGPVRLGVCAIPILKANLSREHLCTHRRCPPLQRAPWWVLDKES